MAVKKKFKLGKAVKKVVLAPIKYFAPAKGRPAQSGPRMPGGGFYSKPTRKKKSKAQAKAKKGKKGQVPLDLLESRLGKLNAIVKKRGGDAFACKR